MLSYAQTIHIFLPVLLFPLAVRKELEEFKAKIAGVQMEAQLYRENARARAAVPQPAAEDPSATPAGTALEVQHRRLELGLL